LCYRVFYGTSLLRDKKVVQCQRTFSCARFTYDYPDDECCGVLNYIAMNDLERHDAERVFLSQQTWRMRDPSEIFRILRTIRRRASLLTNSPSGL
jgi:hypothetical protein